MLLSLLLACEGGLDGNCGTYDANFASHQAEVEDATETCGTLGAYVEIDSESPDTAVLALSPDWPSGYDFLGELMVFAITFPVTALVDGGESDLGGTMTETSDFSKMDVVSGHVEVGETKDPEPGTDAVPTKMKWEVRLEDGAESWFDGGGEDWVSVATW